MYYKFSLQKYKKKRDTAYHYHGLYFDLPRLFLLKMIGFSMLVDDSYLVPTQRHI